MAEKRRVHGVVDRVEGEVIVVVVKDPDDGINKEIYVKKKQLKRIELKEGDDVTVEMSQMIADTKSKTVSLVFSGMKSGDMAKKFFTYLVDGGLEDIIIQAIAGHGVVLGISGFDKKTLTVNFEVGKDKPAKKPVKKAVKAPVKTKAPTKKVSASRGKKR